MMSTPRETVIEVTARCNLNCFFCFNKSSFASDGREQQELSGEAVRYIIDETARNRIPAVRFTGGEPLLRNDIFSLFSYAQSKGLYVMLNTNGTCITHDIVRRLEGFIDNVLVPINSHNNEQSEIHSGKRNCLDIRLKALSLLRESGIPVVRAGTIASRDNIYHLGTIFSLLKGLSLDSWEVYRQVGSEELREPLGKADVRVLVEKLLRFKRKGHYVPIANALPFCAYDPQKTSEVSLGASFDDGHSRFVVDPRGYIKPSYFIDENLGGYTDLMSAWEHPFLTDTLKTIPRACNGCPFVSKCKGGSRYAAHLMYGDYSASDPLARPEKVRARHPEVAPRDPDKGTERSVAAPVREGTLATNSSSAKKNVMIYCQSCYGIGHFMVSLNVAKELAQYHDVLLVYGGERYGIPIPKTIRFLQLPAMRDDQNDRHKIISDEGGEEEIKRKRIGKLTEATRVFDPDVALVEHFPFGRSNFIFELSPFLRVLRERRARIFSLKAVISANGSAGDALGYIPFFDKILVCTDSRVEKLDEEAPLDGFRDKVEYCGYVVDEQKEREDHQVKQERNQDNETLITACVGGGIEGYRRLRVIIQAINLMQDQVRLQVFTGPQISQEDFNSLQEYVRDDRKVRITTFSSGIMSYMACSDLVISMAGINSFAEILSVNTKVIFLPLGNEEQDRRVRNLQKLYKVTALHEKQLGPESLAWLIRVTLSEKCVDFDLDFTGRKNIARIVAGK